NERAVNEKSPYCFFVCTTFDSFLNDLCALNYLDLYPLSLQPQSDQAESRQHINQHTDQTNHATGVPNKYW
ncbi:hypothetical protein, partial [Ruminococcus sp. RTP21358st1_G6_RTP21358_211008]|uniref:hypothetical protein n=1 Tax=Ruminococcus sp. RTP21358st1_G6_RTP21358_211008 TaxID=3141605 RepID=UPI0034A5364D